MAWVTGVAGVSGERMKIVIAPDLLKGNLSASEQLMRLVKIKID